MNLNNCLLKVNGLSFERGNRDLFHNLNFSISAGTVLQVIGENGVGKSTLLRILAGLIHVEQGDVQWCGQSIQDCATEYRADLFYIGHQSGITLGLTPRENLRMVVALHSVKLHHDNNHAINNHLDECLSQFQLLAYADVPVMQLSAGQQRRLALAALTLCKAKLWLLDEPFTALDQAGIEHIEMLLYLHTQQGGSAIIATHQALRLESLRLRQLELHHA